MTCPRGRVWLAAACLLMMAGCGHGINVGARGGSASDVEWKVGVPF